MVEELFRQMSKFTFIHSSEVSLLPTNSEHYKQDDEQDQSLYTTSQGKKTNTQKLKRQIK